MIEYIKMFILSLINGVMMPLPVSSSAHVSFLNKVLDYTDKGETLSFYYAVFSVAFSLVIFFSLRKIYGKVFKSLFTKNDGSKHTAAYKKAGKNIFLSILPAVLLFIPVSEDMLVIDYFDKFLSSSGLLLTAFASLISALVFVTAIWYTKQSNSPTYRNASTKTVLRSAVYELVAFVVPGTSKIAIGSVNMLICDVEPKVIMRDVYLYSAPVIFAVSVVKIIRGLIVDLVVDPLAVIIGAAVSIIASSVIVYFVSKVNMRKLMGFFAWYSVIFGVSAFIMSLV
ncbi:MAG: hypothetical protein IKB12_01390 [Clostridia bacterium]|nr:hypothetical protein [Clostridia bacterium]